MRGSLKPSCYLIGFSAGRPRIAPWVGCGGKASVLRDETLIFPVGGTTQYRQGPREACNNAVTNKTIGELA